MPERKEVTAAQMLLEARTSGRRKREIPTIAKLLCIREEYLTALEKGDYKSIPEPVYALGFARNYAIELGLNPDEIVNKIKKEMGIEDKFESESDEEAEEEMMEDSDDSVKKMKAIGRKALEKTTTYAYKHWRWIVSIIIGLVILIAGLSFVLSLGRQSDEYKSEEAAEAVVKEPEYNIKVREKFGTENATTANVIIQASQESWVKIEDARGNTVFSRVLVAGDVYYVPSGDIYKGTFGNAGGVDIWVNGKLAPKLGAVNARKSGVLMNPNGLMPAAEPQQPAAPTED
ncbi:MAG TPA: DUF4115 domain-containing protein [Alphaproteobacteria bacterium]|nr:DUF4115 domain-containing protein [Alphaproteobacteria bacterium]